MNSKYIIIDTINLPLTMQLDWWKTNKKIYLYPKIWDNIEPPDLAYYKPYLNVIETEQFETVLTKLMTSDEGVLFMTSDNIVKDTVTKMSKKIDKENPNTDNRFAVGDEILYETPFASVDDIDLIWWVDKSKGEDIEEVYQDFRKKYIPSNFYNITI